MSEPIEAIKTAELRVSECLSEARDAHGAGDGRRVARWCARAIAEALDWDDLAPSRDEDGDDHEPF